MKFTKYSELFTNLICYFLIIIFFIFYFNLRDYGLPYFLNADETAGMKSLLYFYGFFSYANQNVVEPIYFPFITFFVTGFLILTNNFLSWGYSINELKDYIYLNPDVLYEYGRVASLIFCTFSLFIFYKIGKKIKLNNFFLIFSLLSLSLSYLFTDIAIILGKNSLLLFLFISQYYLFIKYANKLENFNSKSYIAFGLISSLAWGINYWAATPSFYAILYLHFQKYKFGKINYLLLFATIFLILGLFLNLYLSGDKIIHHLINPEFVGNESRIKFFLKDFREGIKIFYNFEKIIFIFLVALSILSFFKLKNIKKKFLIFNLILISEPIILFAVADYSYPQLRYFGPSIFLAYITVGFILNAIIDQFRKLGIILLFLICTNLIIYSEIKAKILINSKRILTNTSHQYDVFNEYSNLKPSIYFTSYMTYRENVENLNLYKDLLNHNLIVLNPDADGKNSMREIEKKKAIINRSKNFGIYPNSKNNIFFGGEYIINDPKKFLDFLKMKYEYIIINKEHEFAKLVNENYKPIKTYEGNKINTFRSLTNLLTENYRKSYIENIEKIGLDLIVFELN